MQALDTFSHFKQIQNGRFDEINVPQAKFDGRHRGFD
jgi:hypothetical protein